MRVTRFVSTRRWRARERGLEERAPDRSNLAAVTGSERAPRDWRLRRNADIACPFLHRAVAFHASDRRLRAKQKAPVHLKTVDEGQLGHRGTTTNFISGARPETSLGPAPHAMRGQNRRALTGASRGRLPRPQKGGSSPGVGGVIRRGERRRRLQPGGVGLWALESPLDMASIIACDVLRVASHGAYSRVQPITPPASASTSHTRRAEPRLARTTSTVRQGITSRSAPHKSVTLHQSHHDTARGVGGLHNCA